MSDDRDIILYNVSLVRDISVRECMSVDRDEAYTRKQFSGGRREEMDGVGRGGGDEGAGGWCGGGVGRRRRGKGVGGGAGGGERDDMRKTDRK